MAQMRKCLMYRYSHLLYTSSIIFKHKSLNISECALERDGEEPYAVHAAAARGGDHRRQEAQDTQDHQLDQAGAQHSLLRISIKVMRISLLTLTLIGIRFWIFTLLRIRIRDLLIIKVIRICDHGHIFPPLLHFQPSGLQYDRPLPSMASFWALTAPEHWLWCGSGSGSAWLLTLMRIPIRLFTLIRFRILIWLLKMMRIWIRTPLLGITGCFFPI